MKKVNLFLRRIYEIIEITERKYYNGFELFTKILVNVDSILSVENLSLTVSFRNTLIACSETYNELKEKIQEALNKRGE